MERFADSTDVGNGHEHAGWPPGGAPAAEAKKGSKSGRRNMKKSSSQKADNRASMARYWAEGTEGTVASNAGRGGGSDRRHGFYGGGPEFAGPFDHPDVSAGSRPEVWRRSGSRGQEEVPTYGGNQDWQQAGDHSPFQEGFQGDVASEGFGSNQGPKDPYANPHDADRVHPAEDNPRPKPYRRSISDKEGRESDVSGDEEGRPFRGFPGQREQPTGYWGPPDQEYQMEDNAGGFSSGSGELRPRRFSHETGSPVMQDQMWQQQQHEPNWSPAIPEEFLCPISQQLMTDPVIIASGLTYDRSSIVQWFAAGQRYCPKSGHPLDHMNVCPNVTLRQMIRSWASSQGMDQEAGSPQSAYGHGPGSSQRPHSRGRPSQLPPGPPRGPSPLSGRPGQYHNSVDYAEQAYAEQAYLPTEHEAMLRNSRRASSDHMTRPKSQDRLDAPFVSLAEKARQLNLKAGLEGQKSPSVLPPKSPNPASPYSERANTPESFMGVWDSIKAESADPGAGSSRANRAIGVNPVIPAILAQGGSDLHKGGSLKMTRKERDRMLAAMNDPSQGGEAAQDLQMPPSIKLKGRTTSKGSTQGNSNRWERGPIGEGASDQGSPFSQSQQQSPYGEGGYPSMNRPPPRSPSPFYRAPAGAGQALQFERISRGNSGSGWPSDVSPSQGEEHGGGYGYPPAGVPPHLQKRTGLVRTASVPSDFMDHIEVGHAPDASPGMGAPHEGGYMQNVKTRQLVKSSTDRGAMEHEKIPQRPGRAGAVRGASPFSEGSRGGAGASRFAGGGKGGRPGGGTEMDRWVDTLRFGNEEERRAAAKEIRSAVKGSAENKGKLVDAEGIPPLVDALVSTDQELVEHAMMALMNMALHWNSCTEIVLAGGIPLAVKVLSSGTSAARGYAAALLFAASKEEENKLTVRAAGAIRPLLTLLTDGTLRSKKDAALALYTLSTSGRCARDIIKAGAIHTLLKLVEDTDPGLEEKAVALIANLCRFAEGCQSATDAGGMTKMVDLLEEGTTMRVKEDAAAILLQMCASGHITHAQLLAEGVLPSLVLISQSSTSTSEAKTLLEILRKKSAERSGKA